MPTKSWKNHPQKLGTSRSLEFFFSAAPTAKNSPELHFHFINSFIQPSLGESLILVKSQCAKGELISKCLFVNFNSPKKRNEKIRLYNYGTSSQIVFIRFLGELKTPKRPFEINRPLVLLIFFKHDNIKAPSHLISLHCAHVYGKSKSCY